MEQSQVPFLQVEIFLHYTQGVPDLKRLGEDMGDMGKAPLGEEAGTLGEMMQLIR